MAYEDGVFPTFYDEWVQDKKASESEGYPVGKECLWIRIQVPNQTDCVPRPATQADKERFPKSWAAYQTGKEPAEEGFPIEQWTGVSVSELKICQANQIKTVEQLSEVPDSGIHRLGPGGHNLKNRAQKFLKDTDQDLVTRLESRIKELEAQIKKLNNADPEKRPRKKIKIRKAS